MLLVDRRVGSGELAKYLVDVTGVEVQLTDLPFGDFEFMGFGPAGPVSIGIERKTIADFISSVHTGRLHGHQIPGLVQRYSFVWIILEGFWRPSAVGGVVEVPKGQVWLPLDIGGKPILYRELEGLLISLEMNCGVRIRRCSGKVETGRFLASLYHWWQKPFESHKSHLRFQEVAPDVAMLQKPNLVRRWAKELPGIGWEKSSAVAKHFSTPVEMVMADKKEWQKIEGIGKTLAERVTKEIQGA